MAESEASAALARLQACARELEDALARSNAPLPDVLPAKSLRVLARTLGELDDAESDASRQVLVYARDGLRKARWTLRRSSEDDDESPHFAVERALNAAFAEVADLLEPVPTAQLIAFQPPPGSPSLVVYRDDGALVGKLDALAARVAWLEKEVRQTARHVGTEIHHYHGDYYELNLIKQLKVNLDSLVKIATTISAELRAQLIDLDWLAQLTKRVGELKEALKGGADALKRAGGELADILKQVGRVRRLAERVVSGGAALYRFIMRAVGPPPPERLPDLTGFRDHEDLPEMVVIPAGTFLMGSPEGEEGRSANEGPRHEVRIARRFALGRHPVTFAEYGAFCAATGNKFLKDEGWGRGWRPVINVSWHDARAYCAWLSRKTGKPYRLPSEAEWEYACRAGTAMPYWWGDAITPEWANYSVGAGRTEPVLRYPPNPWGLHDMHGNVSEWVEDKWHDSYDGAPSEGSAWVGSGVTRRVLRGGSWSGLPRVVRAANRGSLPPETRSSNAGFRVARTLTR